MQAAHNSASAPPISERTLSSQESRPLPISLAQSTRPESRWSTIVSALCHVPTLGLPVVYRRWISEYLGHMEASYPEIDFRGLANRNARVNGVPLLRDTKLGQDLQLQSGRLLKRLVIGWKWLVGLNSVVLTLVISFFPSLCTCPVTRELLFLTTPTALVALLEVVLYLVQFDCLQDGTESTTWLLLAISNDTIVDIQSFFALPAIWSAWSSMLFTASLLSFIWTPESNGPTSLGDQGRPGDMDRRAAQVPWWLALAPTAIFMIGLWTLWIIRTVFVQSKKFEANHV